MSDFHVPGLDPVFNEIRKLPGGNLFVRIVCVVIGLALLGFSTKIVTQTLVEPGHDLMVALLSRWRGIPQIHTTHVLDLLARPVAVGITAGLAVAALYYLSALQRRVNNIRWAIGEHGGIFKDILALIKLTNADLQTLSKMSSEHLHELAKMGAEHLHESTKDLLVIIQHLRDAMAAQQEQIRLLKEQGDLLRSELAIVGKRKK
jgi:hypothetical protein